MSVNERIVKRYSESFKLQVIEEIERTHCSIDRMKRKYGITGNNTIKQWIKKYGRTNLMTKKIRIETLEEEDHIKTLQKRIKELESALADSILRERAYREVVAVASQETGIDLKKKYSKKS